MFRFSSRIDKPTEVAIRNLLAKVLEDFEQLFAAAYINELISKYTEEALLIAETDKRKSLGMTRSSHQKNLLLKKPPLRSDILKQGIMSKQGGVVKTWKKRLFIVWNAKNDFKIEYYESEGGRLKGSIGGSGYLVSCFDQSDIEKYGPHGLKLIPFQPCRRTWVFRCEDDQLRSDWILVLQQACHKADSIDDPNPAVANAFKNAFESLRYKYEFTAFYKHYGRETERLGDFIRQILTRDLSLTKAGEEAADKMVALAVSSSWRSTVANVNADTAQIDQTIRVNLQHIKLHIYNIKTKILTAISSSFDAFLAMHKTQTFRPILEAVIDPMAQSFTQAVRSLFAALTSKLVDGEFSSKEKKDAALKEFIKQLDTYWQPESLSYWPAQLLMNMFSDQSLEGIFQSASYPAASVSRTCIDAVADLTHGAICTFEVYSDTHDGSNFSKFNSNIVVAIRTFIHDAKIVMKGCVLDILRCLIRKPLLLQTQNYSQQLEEIAQQPAEAGSAEAGPEAGLVDLDLMLQQALLESADAFLLLFVQPYMAECEATIDAVEIELSTFSPKESVKMSRDKSNGYGRASADSHSFMSPRASADRRGVAASRDQSVDVQRTALASSNVFQTNKRSPSFRILSPRTQSDAR